MKYWKFMLMALFCPPVFAANDTLSGCVHPIRDLTPEASSKYARCLLDQQAALEAASFLEKSVETYADDPELFNLLGVAYLRLNRLELAIEYLQQAYDLDTTNLKAAQALLHALFDRIMQISPQQLRARKATLPEACWYQGEVIPAEQAEELTAEYINLAMMLTDQIEEQTSNVEQCADARMLKGMLLFELNRDKEAFTMQESAVAKLLAAPGFDTDAELRSGASMILVNMANQYAAVGDQSKARYYAHRALDAAPEQRLKNIEFLTADILNPESSGKTMMDLLTAGGCDPISTGK